MEESDIADHLLKNIVIEFSEISSYTQQILQPFVQKHLQMCWNIEPTANRILCIVQSLIHALPIKLLDLLHKDVTHTIEMYIA